MWIGFLVGLGIGVPFGVVLLAFLHGANREIKCGHDCKSCIESGYWEKNYAAYLLSRNQ